MTAIADRATATPVRFGQRPARGLVAGLSLPRVAALAGAVLAVAAATATVGVAAGLVTAVAVSPLVGGAAITVDGRCLLEWVPIAAHHALTHRAGQRISPFRPPIVGSLGLTADVRLLESADGTALIHDPRRGSYTAVAAVHGRGFLLADPDTQDAATAGWGRALAGLAADGQITRIQVLHATRPDTGAAARRWSADRLDPEASAFAADTYTELLTTAGGWRHDTLLAITLEGARAAAAIRRAGRGHTGADTVMTAHRAALENSLAAADLTVQTWLRPATCVAAARLAVDPDSAPHLDGIDDPAFTPIPGPAAITQQWSAVRTDSAWHRVLWVSQWPRADTHPAFLAPLLRPDPGGAIVHLSLIYQPIPTATALRDIRRDKTANISDRGLKQRLGQLDTASDAAAYTDADQREADIVAGHADMRHTALITITARNADELDDATARIRQAAATSGCDTRILYGQQLAAFHAAALPLTRGL